MPDFTSRVVANFLTYAFLWAGYIGYHWWADGGLVGQFADLGYYMKLAGAVLVVSVVQAHFEIKSDREERRKLEGDW